MKVSTPIGAVIGAVDNCTNTVYRGLRGWTRRNNRLVVSSIALFSTLLSASVQSQALYFVHSETAFADLELNELNTTSKSTCSLSTTDVDFLRQLPNKLCSDDDGKVLIIDDRGRASNDGIVVELMMNHAEKITREAAGRRFPDNEIDSMIGHVRELIRTTEKAKAPEPIIDKTLHLYN